MNKYMLMLAAAGLIAAAPAYYAFQAQADEPAPAVTGEAATPAPDATSAEAPATTTEEGTPEAAEPAAGTTPVEAPAAE